MPNVQYVLVADASRGRLLRWSDEQNLEEVATYLHPQSRLQNRELQSDGPARNQAFPGGPGSASVISDAHRMEAERFARTLADTLRDARVHQAYDQLVLVAPPRFLGMLREALDTPTSKTILTSVANAFTHLPTHALGPAIRRHLS